MTNTPSGDTHTNLENLLETWRSQRRKLLLNIQAVRHPPPENQEQFADRINTCCQGLLDYLCMGHFLVFTRVLQNIPGHADPTRQILRSVYWQIGYATDIALAFNDKYDTEISLLREEPSLPGDIRQMIRVMLIRFELEDMLIDLAVNN